MPGEITLADAIERVDANSITERAKGLADLRHVLRNNNKFDSLGDVSFHRLYEVLFRVSVTEQSEFLKAKTTKTRSAAEARLSACSGALRLAVEVGARLIKLKTVKAVLDHASEILLLPGGKFCEPLALDYAKCMRTILGYQAHVEHLPQKERDRVGLFCVDCIQNAESELAEDDVSGGAEGISTTGAINGMSYRSSRSHIKDSGGSQGSRSLAKQIAEEMVACISLLTAAPNASCGTSSSALLSALIRFLQNRTVAARSSHQDAFAGINHIIARTRTESIEETRVQINKIIRLIKYYWSVKSSPTLKDEMLITWIHLRPYIFSALQLEDNPALRSELSGALDVMRTEYSSRKERDQLQMEDLRLDIDDISHDRSGVISATIFALKSRKARAEANWVTVYMLASLCNALADLSDGGTSSSDEDDDIHQRPRKRIRLTNEFEDTLASSKVGSHSSRVCALHTLTFLAQQQLFSRKQLAKAISDMSISCAEDNITISSWSFLALASIASQAKSTDPSLSNEWISVWQLASRAMSNMSTCRSTCHLLYIMLSVQLVPPSYVSELVQSMTASMDLNGPSMLADSVAHLLMFAVKSSQQINPANSFASAESVLSWLFRMYLPSKFEDRVYASQQVLFEPRHVVDLVACCLGQFHTSFKSHEFPLWDSLGQVWLACMEQQSLVEYLLLLPKPPAIAHKGVQRIMQVQHPSSQPRSSCEALVLSHLISELYRSQEVWQQLVHERPRGISFDVFTSFCTSCVIAACIAFCSTFRDSRRQHQLQRQVKDLLKALAGFVSSLNCEQDKVDSMLAIVSSICSGFETPGMSAKHSECESVLCAALSKGLEERRTSEEINGYDNEDDAMDLDEAYDSQGSRHGVQSAASHDLKNDFATKYSNAALRSSMTMYAFVVYVRNESETVIGGIDESVSSRVVDYILSLPESFMLLSRGVLSALSNLGVDLSSNDSYRLLDYCSENILRSYLYERSEVAIGSILDIMSSLASAWTDPTNQSLFGLGIDMYDWYTTTALSGGVLSPSVQKRVASLLLQLCHIDTDYGRDNEVPSVRTSLFKLLQLGSVTVQFHLADRISTIFGLFILSNHSAMFADLRESLPDDSESKEGMAMRLLFLSKLASAWHSLLRQCVYYIFETAGRVKSSSKHAARCILALAESLGFQSPQKLFRLFAPQLLHTWLEGHSVASLPFAIFQYDSLAALIDQNQSEITSQLLMRGNDEGIDFVLGALNVTSRDLVIKSFAKCQAYCISWDLTVQSSQQSEPSSESRLRKLIGAKEEYNRLAENHFATVVAQFYLSLQQDDVQENWLDKRPNYGAAATALRGMKSFSYSDRVLPLPQQPSLKSKYLCDQIERLCRRTSHDPVSPWVPSSFALAARILLESLEDALGPLHASMVIRRLRLLICMGGDVAVTGFPLEMLIHTLRPFLNESQCADDVMGVLQYLFHRGQGYLQTNLPFLYGTTTLMVLQMRKHSGAKLDSTTQGSQHRSTVQRMQILRTWLVNYLQKCQFSNRLSITHNYAEFADALASVNLPGNARQDSPESSLLLLLLGQGDTDEALLREKDRDEALALLSENFELPPTGAGDCLGQDVDCAKFSHSLWQAIQIPDLDEAFVVWATGALGRGYASTGRRPLPTPGAERTKPHTTARRYEGPAKSQATIARRLAESLFSRNRLEASLADYTLRSVAMSFGDAAEALTFEEMLPSSVVPAVEGGTYGYVRSAASNTFSETLKKNSLRRLLEPSNQISLGTWAQNISLFLCHGASLTAILPALAPALQNSETLALELLPCIIHILLFGELEKESILRTELSDAIASNLADGSASLHPKQQYLINLLLYLRGQNIPGEKTRADRLRWLEVDWLMASKAAVRCAMPTTALLFAESASPINQGNRRASNRASMSQLSITQVPQELLLSIFKEVEEPDSFYGVEQPASLDSVLDRLDYEADGFRSLMFRTAQTDTHLRDSHQLSHSDISGMMRSLSVLNLNSLTFALLSGGLSTASSSEELMHSALRLQQWDIVPPETISGDSNCFAALQELSRANDRQAMQSRLRSIIMKHMQPMITHERPKNPSYEWFSSLASLVEVREIIDTTGASDIRSKWEQMQSRHSWMHMARYNDFRNILSNRQTLFSILAQNKPLSATIHINLKESLAIEIDSLLCVSRLAREHHQLQEALGAASQASNLISGSRDSGVKADAAAKFETASVLWESGESSASVKMLQDTLVLDLERQDIPIGRSGLLAQLSHQLAEARLEKPDEILNEYLKPAISELHGRTDGQEAGKVFHEFATFCDKQLQNPDNLEDFNRIAKLRQSKLDEVEELGRLSKSARKSGTEKHNYTNDISKAKQWFDIDDADYQRLKQSRDTFLLQSLQNYMLALQASDEHDISILRFFALWLEHSDATDANTVVSKHLPGVPSWKFVVLMNQLMSRLEEDSSSFQSSLKSLATRICSDHPHHSLHHLFVLTRRTSSKDQAAISRYEVAASIRMHLEKDPQKKKLLNNVFAANKHYDSLAWQNTENIQTKRISVKDLPTAYAMVKTIPDLHVAPASINLPLRPDGDYHDVPYVVKFGSNLDIMSGNSRPLKLTAYASNGQTYMQLFKSGKDDLRQDAIMEQVFEEASKMLRNHKTTRQRNLQVRTYKVIPTSPKSGIIEFVPNSTSLGLFLVPAHERYHPEDYKNSTARNKIAAVKDHSTETRVKEFRKVCDHMRPVLRHFFFERYTDPDEWFEKRTAYTRTTATMSILGYVLGLGDRHCQNIMLDEKTGEVVHIDLGIAFEAGRVLPVPELVPFRLSRDVVDGMGITKTEGIFRRCCEFTLDALREDTDSIMTLLNVLRYDPLYNWTVSPLRAKRMQQETGRNAGDADVPEGSSKRKEQEAGEADRALSIVEKKLSKTLSTAATVNELIQQATDEKNLATLFNGWSAWF